MPTISPRKAHTRRHFILAASDVQQKIETVLLFAVRDPIAFCLTVPLMDLKSAWHLAYVIVKLSWWPALAFLPSSVRHAVHIRCELFGTNLFVIQVI